MGVTCRPSTSAIHRETFPNQSSYGTIQKRSKHSICGKNDYGTEPGKETVAAMDILFPYIGEVIGGSQREERYEKLQERIKDQGIHEEELWWYLELRKFGGCPHSGFGLGFERMVQFITGMSNIRDVIAFPRATGTAEF
ncbi:MAG: amino acid--tRNA ligase-related protein [Saprospiraceae bacterium]